MNRIEYKSYLASREWAILREQVRERSGNICERCKTNSQQAVHHLTYERVGCERLDDLQAICKPCHEFLSGREDIDPASPASELELERCIYKHGFNWGGNSSIGEEAVIKWRRIRKEGHRVNVEFAVPWYRKTF